MVLMENFIDQLIKSFKPKTKRFVSKYDEFLMYIYETYSAKITFCRTGKLKDKYIKERDSILEYVVKNKKAILNQLNK